MNYIKREGSMRAIWRWYVRFAYRFAPHSYLKVAKWPFRKNPGFLDGVSGLGEDRWPLVLWTLAQQYVRQGGLTTFPESKGLEDAILQDAALRHTTPGPIKSQVDALSQGVEEAIEALSPGPGEALKGPLRELVTPALFQDRRLAGILGPEDLAQEALLLVQEFMANPGVDWEVGENGSPESIQVSVPFARNVLARLAARKYGSDKQIERRTDYLQDDDPPDSRTDLAYEGVDQRMAIDELMEKLPPKQREAAEVQLRAFREGFSLEEMSRRLGKDPNRTRENFKAVQRRTRK